jgi:hypothetical protein
MPNLIAAGLIFFLGVIGFFCFFYISKAAMAVAIQIVTGVTDGAPIPMAARKKWLYSFYVPYAAMGGRLESSSPWRGCSWRDMWKIRALGWLHISAHS